MSPAAWRPSARASNGASLPPPSNPTPTGSSAPTAVLPHKRLTSFPHSIPIGTNVTPANPSPHLPYRRPHRTRKRRILGPEGQDIFSPRRSLGFARAKSERPGGLRDRPRVKPKVCSVTASGISQPFGPICVLRPRKPGLRPGLNIFRPSGPILSDKGPCILTIQLQILNFHAI